MRADKQLAIKLRLFGSSYNEISKKLSIPKGTLSYWFKDIAMSNKIKESNISSAKEVWAKNISAYNKLRSIKVREKWGDIQVISIMGLLLLCSSLLSSIWLVYRYFFNKEMVK